MAFESRYEGPEPVGRGPVEEYKRVATRGVLGIGTLACPACDVPVALGASAVRPADDLGCPWCGHAANVRDFLSLKAPARPARVQVRVVMRAARSAGARR